MAKDLWWHWITKDIILKLNLILICFGSDESNLRQRQTTILMNHPLGAVEHCVVQDYTVTVPSNQGNGEKGRQIAGLCTRNIDLYTYPQGWRGAGTFYSHANIPKGSFAPRGGRQSLWFPHLMSVFNLPSDWGYWESNMTLKMMGFIGQYKRPCLVSKNFYDVQIEYCAMHLQEIFWYEIDWCLEDWVSV